MSAAVSIPAGGEAGAEDARLISWSADLGPRDDVERYLVRCAVALARELDRTDPGRWPSPDGVARAADDAPAPEAGTGSEWLTPHQVECARALMATLDVLIRLRGRGESAPSESAAGAAGPSDRSRPEEPCTAPGEGPGRQDSSTAESGSLRQRVARRRGRQPDWPGPGDSPSKRPTAGGDRCDPSGIPAGPVQTSWASAEPRRCVGGYPVPLDAPSPVSRADRTPIRLRRPEPGTRPARSASSSHRP